MDYLKIGNTKIEYALEMTSRKKTIELVIDFDKGFTVKAPKHMSKEDVIRNLHKKEKWIIINLDKMSDIFENTSVKEFVSGEKFLIRGRKYGLKVSKSNVKMPSLEFSRNKFIATVPKNISEAEQRAMIRPLFLKYYHLKAEQIISERIRKYSHHFKTKPSKIVVTNLKGKWGSCSKSNQLRFNWRIVLAKNSIIDYVVVHEMCHMVHKDHSKKYWNELKRILPEYEKQKNWLRENSEVLNI